MRVTYRGVHTAPSSRNRNNLHACLSWTANNLYFSSLCSQANDAGGNSPYTNDFFSALPCNLAFACKDTVARRRLKVSLKLLHTIVAMTTWKAFLSLCLFCSPGLFLAITISQQGLWHCNGKASAQYISAPTVVWGGLGQEVYLATKLRSMNQFSMAGWCVLHTKRQTECAVQNDKTKLYLPTQFQCKNMVNKNCLMSSICLCPHWLQ